MSGSRCANASIGTPSHTAALYVVFALTGIGLVLPGTLLPFLVRCWGWQDGRSGGVFIAFFVGTTLGALSARGKLGSMLLLGAVSVAAPLALLTKLRALAVPAAILLLGFGLGLLMTAITLLRSRQVSQSRAAELNRLNLIWAMGAMSAPVLLLHLQNVFGLAATLLIVAVAMLLSGMLAAALSSGQEAAPKLAAGTRRHGWTHMPIPLAIGLPLTTGIEAGVGGWLVTYALRDHATYAATVTAGTALWAGLLLSRLFFSSSRVRIVRARRTPAVCAGVLVLGLLLLLWGLPAVLIAGAFCAGLGIGPLYPELLARWLNRSQGSNAGFLLAGAGSALLPFLIGQVSQRTHSLRTGLTVPLLGSLVLLAMLMHASQQASSHASG